jgi:hypothetical protein
LTPTTTDAGHLWNFALVDLPDYANYQALFEQWRLVKTVADFVWNSVGGPTLAPTLFFACDPAYAGTAPTNLNNLLTRNYKQFTFSETHNSISVDVDTRITDTVSTGSATSGSTNVLALGGKKTWIYTSFPTTAYGNLVAWVENYNTTVSGAVGALNVTFRYILEFRGVVG